MGQSLWDCTRYLLVQMMGIMRPNAGKMNSSLTALGGVSTPKGGISKKSLPPGMCTHSPIQPLKASRWTRSYGKRGSSSAVVSAISRWRWLRPASIRSPGATSPRWTRCRNRSKPASARFLLPVSASNHVPKFPSSSSPIKTCPRREIKHNFLSLVSYDFGIT
jgi:hypothetical protein